MKERRPEQASANERQLHEVDLTELVPGLRNERGEPIGKVVVRLLTTSELESAYAAAAAHADKVGPSSPSAKDLFYRDGSILQNRQALELLWQAFRLPPEEGSDVSYPVFTTPEWLAENLTAQTAGQLANVYTMCEAAENPQMWPELTPEQVEEHRAFIYANLDTEAPEMRLAPHLLSEHGRPFLLQMLCLMAVRWTQEREEAAETIEAMRAELAGASPEPS